MKDLREQVAYLQGLMAGMNLDTNTDQGRLFKAIVNLLEETTDAVMELQSDQEEMESYIESIDEDLADLEDDIYEAVDDEIDDDDEEEFVEVECPKCHEIVCFESDLVEDDDVLEVTCPNCDEVVYVKDDDLMITVDDEQLSVARDIEDI
ncbi:MAG: CD1247 N-terminal domain-containing protein [Bacillota bacterium]